MVTLVVCGGLTLAIGVRIVAGRLSIPTAGLLLVVAAAASDIVDRLSDVLTFQDVQRVATVALVVILFEGGQKIGLRRFRRSAVPDPLARGRRNIRDRRVARGRQPLPVRPLVDGVRPDRRGTRAHRSGGDVLRSRGQGGRGTLGDDPGGRVRLQRPRRHRAHDRDGRARNERRGLVRHGGRRRVPRRDGRWPPGRRRGRARDRRPVPVRTRFRIERSIRSRSCSPPARSTGSRASSTARDSSPCSSRGSSSGTCATQPARPSARSTRRSPTSASWPRSSRSG